MTRLVFCDTETTSLDRWTRRIWELAYIIRDPGAADVEHREFLVVPLHEADPAALKVGGYWDRHPSPYRDGWGVGVRSGEQVAAEVARDFHGATIVGACPSFDEETLAGLLRENGLRETWNYRLLDVGTLVAGYMAHLSRSLGNPVRTTSPLSLDKCLELLGRPRMAGGVPAHRARRRPHGPRHLRQGDGAVRAAPTAGAGCGTYGGYQSHMRRSEYPCAPCAAASAAAQAQWRFRRGKSTDPVRCRACGSVFHGHTCAVAP